MHGLQYQYRRLLIADRLQTQRKEHSIAAHGSKLKLRHGFPVATLQGTIAY
jgi:hypothetical protein